MALETAARPYPLYSTTFTAHRISPLFHSNVTLNNATLRQYASQFRDVITGEVLRGVTVGLAAEESMLARVGALKSVQWSLLKTEEDWESGDDETQVAGEDTTIQEASHAGMLVEIVYEKTIYCAILLHDRVDPSQNEIPGFSHYPLLLTRMPGPLRDTFTNFLATTFDTRASILKLPSGFLAETAEIYLANITTGEHGPLASESATLAIRAIIKDILITLSFDVPGMSSSLKTVDITVSKEDTWQMMDRGHKYLQGDDIHPDSLGAKSGRPFTKALTHYIDTHLALKLDSPHVRISRVACGAFALGTEGKVKIPAPPSVGEEEDLQGKASRALIASLVGLATGGKVVTMIDLT